MSELDYNNLPYGATIQIKDGWFWKLIGFIVKLVSLGKNDKFMTDYITTFGKTIAMPVRVWDTRGTDPIGFNQILTHELTHVKWFMRLGLGNQYLGILVHAIPYIFLPLPFGLAWCRYQFESEAYIEGFKYLWRRNKTNDQIEDIRKLEIDRTFNHMTDGTYGYTMAFCKNWVKKDLTRRFYNIHLSDL